MREFNEVCEGRALPHLEGTVLVLPETPFEWEQLPAAGREWPNEGWDQSPGIARYVCVDLDVMSGMPCFFGTRVPIENVLGSLDIGMSLDEVRKHYAFVTAEHVAAARAYAVTHPLRHPSPPSRPGVRLRMGKRGKSG